MSYQDCSFEHTHEKCADSENTESLWISAIAKLSVIYFTFHLQLMLLFVLVCIKHKTNTSRVSSSKNEN